MTTMTRILQIDASPLGQNSISRKLTARVIERLKAASPQSVVSHRDLIATPVGHLGGELLQVLRPTPGNTPPHSATARGEAAQTEELLSEFLAADVIVIGAPMFNFSIPSQLKAWIDRVVQAGRTFRYTDKGPVGLAGAKRAIVVSSRGGMYAGMPYEAAMDHQEAYLRTVLNFMGITDISYVRAEGLHISPEKQRAALASAELDIAGLALVYPKAA
jgi:FMN-dependent NADH-azoreductase